MQLCVSQPVEQRDAAEGNWAENSQDKARGATEEFIKGGIV